MKTVSNAYFAAFYQSCLDLGADKAEMQALVPGGEQTLGSSNIRYPAACVVELLNKAESLLTNQAIGMKVGKNLRPSDFLDVGHAITFSKNLRQSIAINIRYQPLTQQFGRSSLRVKDGSAWLHWHISDEPEDCRQITESIIASHTQFGRWLIWEYDKAIQGVYFRHKKPSYAEEYEAFFGCPIYYEQDFDAMVFDEAALSQELPQANEKMLKEVCARLDIAMLKLDAEGALSHRLSQLVEIILPRGEFEINKVADYLGVSERSLRRRLDKEGTTYRKIIAETRQRLCERYMRREDMSLKQIANRLSYSEQSAFTRAFRAWNNLSPSKYAKSQGLNIPRDEPEPEVMEATS